MPASLAGASYHRQLGVYQRGRLPAPDGVVADAAEDLESSERGEKMYRLHGSPALAHTAGGYR
jgi:hypothetical protein